MRCPSCKTLMPTSWVILAVAAMIPHRGEAPPQTLPDETLMNGAEVISKKPLLVDPVTNQLPANLIVSNADGSLQLRVDRILARKSQAVIYLATVEKVNDYFPELQTGDQVTIKEYLKSAHRERILQNQEILATLMDTSAANMTTFTVDYFGIPNFGGAEKLQTRLAIQEFLPYNPGAFRGNLMLSIWHTHQTLGIIQKNFNNNYLHIDTKLPNMGLTKDFIEKNIDTDLSGPQAADIFNVFGDGFTTETAGPEVLEAFIYGLNITERDKIASIALRSNAFATGYMLYELVTGENLFHVYFASENARSVNMETLGVDISRFSHEAQKAFSYYLAMKDPKFLGIVLASLEKNALEDIQKKYRSSANRLDFAKKQLQEIIRVLRNLLHPQKHPTNYQLPVFNPQLVADDPVGELRASILRQCGGVDDAEYVETNPIDNDSTKPGGR